MSNSHAKTILEQLHEQYLRGLDCDLIITAVDHLEKTGLQVLEAESKQDVVWKSRSCHKNVLRAASSYFGRIFSNKFTHKNLEVDEGVEGLLVHNENDDWLSLEIILHKMSFQSVQALVNFAYTGFVAIETSILRRAIEDFKMVNLFSIITKLESRLEEDLSPENCIPLLIISFTSGNEEKYCEIISFILEEFFRGLKSRDHCEGMWRKHLTTELSCTEMIERITDELKKEVNKAEKLKLNEEAFRLEILVKLIEFNCISEEEEKNLSSFLITKAREKCDIHLQNILLYCYTDDQEICVECLNDGHAKHLIQTVGAANYERLAPFWEKVDLELESVKQSSRDRIVELDNLIENINTEKLRDIEILDRCSKIKPEMERLSTIFESKRIQATDDVLVLELFIAALKKVSKRSKCDDEKSEQVSEKLLGIVHKRCASCASILDDTMDIETSKKLDEIDLNESLSTKNCISVLKQSKEVGDQHIHDKAFNFLLRKFRYIVKQSGDSFYRRISRSELVSILKSDQLNVEHKDDVVPIVKQWLEFDYRQRRKFASQILRQVRFGYLSEKMLKEIEENLNQVIMMNSESSRLLKNAIVGNWKGSPRDSTVVKVLAFGSSGKASYNSLNGTWTDWQGQNNIHLFCAVIVTENVFILGGRSDREVAQSGVSMYNLRRKIWKNVASMLEARYCFGACVTSTNTIYVMGGQSATHQPLSSVEFLQCDESGEPISGWQKFSALISARSHFEATVIDDKIYVIGGRSNISTMEVFDPKVNYWQTRRSMLRGKDHHTVSTYNGHIYVFGIDGFCEVYNPSTDEWTTKKSLKMAKNVYIRGSIVLNDQVYLIGGDSCKETDIYDIKTNTWSKGPPMPKNIGWTKCVSYR